MNESASAVRSVGGLLTADLLSRLSAGTEIAGLEPGTYGLAAGETLRQAASRTWASLSATWSACRSELENGEASTAERWLTGLLSELGFPDLKRVPVQGLVVGDKTFPVSHQWEVVPVHLLEWGTDLGKRTAGQAGAAGAAPQAMVQELLNRSDDRLWAILSNGQRLRLLRDSTSLVGSAYVEFDLEAIFDGDQFSDFALLYLLVHRSRFAVRDSEKGSASCWLESWRTEAIEHGARAMHQLRGNVAQAVATLGTGFLQHPDNSQLRKQLASGDLDVEDFQRTLLRCVYRLLFWFVAEDRNGLHPARSNATARKRYADYFSSDRLRRTAFRRRGNHQSDLWITARKILDALGDEKGLKDLAVTGIGGVFERGELDEPLDDAALSNTVLLNVVRTLSVVRDPGSDVDRRVDFRNLGAEELGSVYELLLELHPRHDPAQATFALDPVSGSERKTSGTYYTPTSLVECLLDSALNPLIEQAMAADDPETALLDLTICDPACGSGHFLVAAARRLAKQVAAVRTDEAEPTPEAVRSAMRDVIGRCIYGVDINPMAVEIAKIALWLEAMEPGRPLSYLDANLRVGNSLLGATPALLADGLPTDAFKPIEGDDKKFTSALARRNKDERSTAKGQGELFDDAPLRAAALRVAQAAKDLRDRKTPLSLADIHVQSRRHRRLEQSADLKRLRTFANAWCAAFVWQKTPEAPPAITHRVLERLEDDPHSLPADSADELNRLTAAYRFFHWHHEFPQIFGMPEEGEEAELSGWTGGFSCVLGNVPWERVKLQEQEFFAARDPKIAEAPNAAARKRLIKALEHSDPVISRAFLDARRRAEGESHLLRMAGRHPLTGRGDINTYAVFAESGRQVIGPCGRFGIILPTGIATDATTQYFFKDLVLTSSLVSLYDFENAAPLFRGVHRSFKFCLLTLAGRKFVGGAADFAFFLHNPIDLATESRRFSLTPEEITLLNPNTGTCPVFRSRRDAEITLGIYRRLPVLIKDDDPSGNPWGISFMTMFHMSNDSHLFHTRDQLEEAGWKLAGSIFEHGKNRMMPLHEGKMGNQFDASFAGFYGHADTAIRKFEHNQESEFPLPRYWVAESEVSRRLERRKFSCSTALLGHRRVARNNDERTSIAALIPWGAASYGWIISAGPNAEELAILVAIYNSFIFDFCLRNSLSQPSIPQGTSEQLPTITVEVLRKSLAPAISDPLAWIIARVIELSYTSRELEKYADELGFETIPFVWSDLRRAEIRAELDAAMFIAYGIAREEVIFILSSFPITAKRESTQLGEFKSERLILKAYDALEYALQAKSLYKTDLEPPPGVRQDSPAVSVPQ